MTAPESETGGASFAVTEPRSGADLRTWTWNWDISAVRKICGSARSVE